MPNTTSSTNHLREQEDATRIPVQVPPGRVPLIDTATYEAMYTRSIQDPEGFWAEQAEATLHWEKKWDRVQNTSFEGEVHMRWFEGAKLNVCYNCVDRHLKRYGGTRDDQTAIIWEGDDPTQDAHITYAKLHEEVCRFANILLDQGVKKGDVVTLYMPMIPEAAYAMLACARIGAIHSVVFGGFSPQALASRITDGGSRFIITADEGVRGGKAIALKKNVDAALALVEHPAKVLIVPRTGADIPREEGRDICYQTAREAASLQHEAQAMEAEDPLFILYTSGSTGKPKGILHTSGGYLLYAALTHLYGFDYQEGEIYWCTADVGWITGHSYILYGPLANGATTLMFEGVPTYPTTQRCWQVVDKHQVNIFYTAPTAIRALMADGHASLQGTSRASLRLLGTVGEPINPEAWQWYYREVGQARCPIIDTWWQTETGGFLITPLPYAHALKPGSASLPFFGIQPQIVDEKGTPLEGEAEGNLCMAGSWPGQMRSVWGDHQRFIETYFAPFTGKYFSGDGARRDLDGYYWITGRVDDVLNVSGHRIGTAEVESALVAHPNVAEAAVVGYPHAIKGQGIYVFVTLTSEATFDDALRAELIAWVRKEIGPVATPDLVQHAPGLPKTRSGKIMRRILRKIAANDYAELGETSTLLNPEAVEHLIEGRLNR